MPALVASNRRRRRIPHLLAAPFCGLFATILVAQPPPPPVLPAGLGLIQGKVLGSRGPVAATITAESADREKSHTDHSPQVVLECRTDSSGRYALTVPGGPYFVRVRTGRLDLHYRKAALRNAGFMPDTVQAKGPVTLDFLFGSVAVDVVVPSELEGARATCGITTGPASGPQVSLDGEIRFTGGKGSVTFDPVPAGDYAVSLSLPTTDFGSRRGTHLQGFQRIWSPGTFDARGATRVTVEALGVAHDEMRLPAPAILQGALRGSWQLLTPESPPAINVVTAAGGWGATGYPARDGSFRMSLFVEESVRLRLATSAVDLWFGGDAEGDATLFSLVPGAELPPIEIVESGILCRTQTAAGDTLAEAYVTVTDEHGNQITRSETRVKCPIRLPLLGSGVRYLHVFPLSPHCTLASQWFDGASSRETATPIVVPSDGSVVTVKMTLRNAAATRLPPTPPPLSSGPTELSEPPGVRPAGTEVDPAYCLLGRVTDGEGPTAGFSVAAVPVETSSQREVRIGATSGSDGAYRLTLPPGRYTIEISGRAGSRVGWFGKAGALASRPADAETLVVPLVERNRRRDVLLGSALVRIDLAPELGDRSAVVSLDYVSVGSRTASVTVAGSELELRDGAGSVLVRGLLPGEYDAGFGVSGRAPQTTMALSPTLFRRVTVAASRTSTADLGSREPPTTIRGRIAGAWRWPHRIPPWVTLTDNDSIPLVRVQADTSGAFSIETIGLRTARVSFRFSLGSAWHGGASSPSADLVRLRPGAEEVLEPFIDQGLRLDFLGPAAAAAEGLDVSVRDDRGEILWAPDAMLGFLRLEDATGGPIGPPFHIHGLPVGRCRVTVAKDRIYSGPWRMRCPAVAGPPGAMTERADSVTCIVDVPPGGMAEVPIHFIGSSTIKGRIRPSANPSHRLGGEIALADAKTGVMLGRGRRDEDTLNETASR